MESLQNLKRRLKGVTNINQITRAMELVAATKMRKSQEIALASRPYAFSALDFLARLTRLETAHLPKLLEKRGVKTTAIVVVTSDKGLAGSFNSAVIRAVEKFIRAEKIDFADPAYAYIAVGQKAAAYLERRTPNFKRAFTRFGDYTTIAEIEPLAKFLTEGFLRGDWDRVLVFSMRFESALRQDMVFRELLPASAEALLNTLRELVPKTGRFANFKQLDQPEAQTGNEDYLIEPSPQEILDELAAHLTLMEIYHLVLEANASEHAARRVAMKNASDNANELRSELTLVYNKARQAAITKEIIEITAGAESLK